MKYRREIDGLRALAVLPVIFFHAGLKGFDGGFVGVDVFFVISGYLITSIILAEKEAGTFSLIKFYERRARRILPALFFVMAACIPFAWLWLLPGDMKGFSDSLAAIAVFASNILFWSESGYFDTAAELKPLLHTWSLAVEEQYYVLFPLFMILAWRLGRRWMVVLLAIAAVISLAVAEWGNDRSPAAAFFLLPTRGWELALGALVALYLARRSQATPSLALKQVASVLGALLIVYAIFAFDSDTPFPGMYALVPTAGTALIILFAAPDTAVGRLLGTKVLVGVGLISYSAYLWHQPLFAFARHKTLTEPDASVFLVLSASAIALAYFSWRFVEQPFRRPGFISRKKLFLVAISASATFLVFGFLGSRTDGFAFRMPAAQNEALETLTALQTELYSTRQAGVCHFNDRIKISIDDFLAKWNCKGEESPGSRKIALAVTGDSHAADLGMAIRENGYAPLQLSSSGCSLVPRFMTPDCKRVFQRLHEELRADPFYTHIALVNYYKERALSEEAVLEMLAYWKKFDKQIILFVGMPNFPYYKEKLLKRQLPTMDSEVSLLSKRAELLALYRDSGVHVVDRDEYFCAINGCRYFDKDGSLLLTDPTHLSVGGAKKYGQALLSGDPVLKKLVGP